MKRARFLLTWYKNEKLNGHRYWLSMNVLGIPPVWISRIAELEKLYSYCEREYSNLFI